MSTNSSGFFYYTNEELALFRRIGSVCDYFRNYEADILLTFTYRNECLPVMSKHPTDLFNRMNVYCGKYLGIKVEYWWGFEFGKEEGRPHLHSVIDLQGLDLEDFPRDKLWDWWPHGDWYPSEIYNVERLMWYLTGVNNKVNKPNSKYDTRFINRYFDSSRSS